MENQPTRKTAAGIIDSKTFIKDGLITTEKAAECMEEYADLKVKEFKEDFIKEIQGMFLIGLPELHSLKMEGYNKSLLDVIEKLK